MGDVLWFCEVIVVYFEKCENDKRNVLESSIVIGLRAESFMC